MQLKKKTPAGSRPSLVAATLGLLGAATPQAQAGGDPKWEFDTGVLVYSESGGRVQAAEPVVSATRALADDRSFSVKLVVDTLTGASPNGAAPASTPQTFSRPSGAGQYTTAPNQTPLDDTFHDTRLAVAGDYTFPVMQSGKLGLGLSASSEYDFISMGGNLHYTLDLNQHNTSLSAAINYEADTIKPVGGVPIALSVVPAAPSGTNGKGDASESKTVSDFVLGATQVLDPSSLVQVNYSLSLSSGYQTDPYKVLSVVGSDGEPVRYVYESRPDSRTKQAVFLRYKRFVFAQDVFDLSYRYMTDSWRVKSSTADVLYRWNFSENNFLEPHVRWYTQTAPNFYKSALFDGQEAVVQYASADPRLGSFDGYTGGLKFGHNLRGGSQLSLRLEYYQQVGKREGVPPQAAAAMEKFKLEPDVSAVMLTLGYRFKW